ncbi:MAG: ATP-binding protein [Planctomycetia bacterium]|nr:ATP-binding protein [Planctomycetia bacterium]
MKHLPIDFTAKSHEGTRQLTCLIGDNGSGKTTVLQAIALTLSLATRRTREPSAFNWHGFLAHRVASLGPTRVELDVALDHEEVALTRTLFQDWYDSLPADFRQTRRIVPPSENKEVTLVYESGRVTSPQGFEAVNQFLGRYYIKQLQKTQPQRKELFRSLGDVFWFDQYRNLGTASGARAEDGEAVDGEPESWKAGVEQLREFLVGWWSYHLAPAPAGRRQFLPMLEERFQQVFPDVRFRGIRPRDDVAAPRAADFEFLLESDGKVYDLAEMSSGEQAVFPLLYEFVRLDIARSIVLIDELELHLHPPQQQALLAALPRIGPDCQFIITTHSSFLEEVIPDEHEVRLPGGQRCL